MQGDDTHDNPPSDAPADADFRGSDGRIAVRRDTAFGTCERAER